MTPCVQAEVQTFKTNLKTELLRLAVTSHSYVYVQVNFYLNLPNNKFEIAAATPAIKELWRLQPGILTLSLSLYLRGCLTPIHWILVSGSLAMAEFSVKKFTQTSCAYKQEDHPQKLKCTPEMEVFAMGNICMTCLCLRASKA